MENPGSTRIVGGGIEENILAILDSTEAKDTQDSYEDRIAFLEAVRAASIVPNDGTPPSSKMFEAIFSILKIGKSLELTMASFQLLVELHKRFPRVYISDVDKWKSPSSVPELIVVKEDWNPFGFSFENASNENEGPVDSSGLQLLVQEVADATDEANFQASETKSLGNMLLLQYLVSVFEEDFLPRNSVYEETMNWVVLKESLLNTLLVSRKVNYKSLMKDCLTIMCELYQTHAGFTGDLIRSENSVAQPAENLDTAAAIALLEIGKNTCIAIQKFLILIMELDVSKKSAAMQGSITRADGGVRTPLVEIILDELTYNKDILYPFLQVFNDPKWKLEVVVQYLWKYIGKPSVRTRKSNGHSDDASFSGALKCFSNISSTKTTIKKIRTDVVQVLLAHGFQAQLSLPCEQSDICESIISAYKNMKTADKQMEISPLGKEALFTAATIISTKS